MAKRQAMNNRESPSTESRTMFERQHRPATGSDAGARDAIVLGLTDEGDVNLRIPHQDLRIMLGVRAFDTPAQALLDRIEERLGEDGTERVLRAALAAVASSDNPQLREITGIPDPSDDEAARAAAVVTARSHMSRNALLADALSTTDAGRMLHLTRQGVTERIKRGDLLAVRAGRSYRLPPWQFDGAAADGLVPGLPAVLHVLAVSPLAQASWLTRPSPHLDGETPLAALKGGNVETVVAEARAVGAAEW